jgi:4'-phosphopantetheinyl transferase
MNTRSIFQWPNAPTLQQSGQVVLVRRPVSASRQMARAEVRTTLRQILATWSGLTPEQLPLHENSRGPIWHGQLAGDSLDISLSYADDEGWIALRRGGLIGVDVASVKSFAEMDEVARHYLGPAALATIRQSREPAGAFALAWTELESRLKCLKGDLTEWRAASTIGRANCASQAIVLGSHVVCVTTSN